MIFIEWSGKYEMGIELIDRQHRELVDSINTLYTSIMLNKEKSGIDLLIQFLIDYSHEHFSIEELMMREIDYGKADLHRSEHSAFHERMVDFSKTTESVIFSPYEELFYFLNSWVVGHLMHTDRDFYREYLKARSSVA